MSKYKDVGEQIRIEYEETNITLKELSLKYSISRDTLTLWKQKYNWKEKKIIHKNNNEDKIKECKSLFENTEKNLKQISELLNIPRNTLQTWKQKYNWIKKDKFMQDYKNSINKANIKIYENDTNVIIIKQLYETTSLSIPEIAKQLNTTTDKVRNRIKKFKFIRSEELKHKTNKRKGLERQNNLSEIQKIERNIKIKKWNLNNIGKIHLTRKLRNRYSKSQIEDNLYKALVEEFGEDKVERQYILDNKSYDFKIIRSATNSNHKNKIIEQLIELNGGFYHNYRPYIDCIEHNEEYNELLARGGMYKTIAHKWKDIDTAKFNYCKNNNLNYTCIYYDIHPKPYFTKQELINSYKYIKNQDPIYTNISRNNEIIDNFCYKEIYKNNFEYFYTDDIYKYLVNRIKYAYNYGEGCHNITMLKLLKDFNKTKGMLQGFTMHSITNIRKFIKDYNVQTILDPFAGWGHRLIGAMSMNCNYIGIDINNNQVNNLFKIKEFIKSIDSINSEQLIIQEDSNEINYSLYNYDAIFTCPPYWSKEIYTDKGIENLNYSDFKKQFKNIFNKCITNNVKVIGIQFTDKYEDCITQLNLPFIKIPINQGIHHLTKTDKKYKECIYILNII